MKPASAACPPAVASVRGIIRSVSTYCLLAGKRSPVVLMVLSTLIYGTLPTIFVLGIERGGLSSVTFVALLLCVRSLLWIVGRGRRFFDDIKVIRPRYYALGFVAAHDWALYSLALVLIDPVLVAVLGELWPIFFGLLTMSSYWRVHGLNENTAKAVTSIVGNKSASVLIPLVIAAAGAGLVTFSEGDRNWDGDTGVWVLGVLLGLCSGLLGAFSVGCGQLMGADPRPEGIAWLRDTTPAMISMSGWMLISPAAALAALLVGVGIDAEAVWSFSAFGLVVVCVGSLFHVTSVSLFIAAIHLSTQREKRQAAKIGSIWYFAIVLSVGLLLLTGASNITRLDLLIAGIVLVLCVNIYSHGDRTNDRFRRAFKAALSTSSNHVHRRSNGTVGGKA